MHKVGNVHFELGDLGHSRAFLLNTLLLVLSVRFILLLELVYEVRKLGDFLHHLHVLDVQFPVLVFQVGVLFLVNGFELVSEVFVLLKSGQFAVEGLGIFKR